MNSGMSKSPSGGGSTSRLRGGLGSPEEAGRAPGSPASPSRAGPRRADTSPRARPEPRPLPAGLAQGPLGLLLGLPLAPRRRLVDGLALGVRRRGHRLGLMMRRGRDLRRLGLGRLHAVGHRPVGLGDPLVRP